MEKKKGDERISPFRTDCMNYRPANPERGSRPEEHCVGWDVPVCWFGCTSYMVEGSPEHLDRYYGCIARLRKIGHPLGRGYQKFLKKYGEVE